MNYKDTHIRFPKPLGDTLTEYLSKNKIVLNQYVVFAVREKLEKDLKKQKDLSTPSEN